MPLPGRLDYLFEEGQVLIDHPVRAEPRFCRQPARSPIDLRYPSDRSDGAVDIVDQESGSRILQQFSHRASRVGNHRCAGGQRFHDRKAERLVETDQVQQGQRATEESIALGWSDWPEVDDIRSELRRDSVVEIGPILNRTGDDQSDAGLPRYGDRPMNSFSGWIRPRNNRFFPGSGWNRKLSRPIP